MLNTIIVHQAKRVLKCLFILNCVCYYLIVLTIYIIVIYKEFYIVVYEILLVKHLKLYLCMMH